MKWSSVIVIVVALVAWALLLGWACSAEITVTKTTTHYRVDLALDAAAVRWSVQPQTGVTINRTGPKTATADLVAGTYEVTAWTRDKSGTTLEITVGDVPPVPPVPPIPGALIESFTVVPDTIAKGATAKLSWSAPKAKTATLQGLAVVVAGSQDAKPDATITYILVVSDGAKIESAAKTLTVTDPAPPVPPNPGDGLRVLIVENPLDRAALPAPQREIIMSIAPGSVNDYMSQNCKKVNNVAEWRILDVNHLDVSRESKDWQDAVSKWKTLNLKTPSWIVTDGATADAGVLPGTKDEAISILKKHTPNKVK